MRTKIRGKNLLAKSQNDNAKFTKSVFFFFKRHVHTQANTASEKRQQKTFFYSARDTDLFRKLLKNIKFMFSFQFP